jgi:hypothetical protein
MSQEQADRACYALERHAVHVRVAQKGTSAHTPNRLSFARRTERMATNRLYLRGKIWWSWYYDSDGRG